MFGPVHMHKLVRSMLILSDDIVVSSYHAFDAFRYSTCYLSTRPFYLVQGFDPYSTFKRSNSAIAC